MLHQMTWPPQLPDLNPNEMIWDEMDLRVKETHQTSAQHMWNPFKTVEKSFQVKLVERMLSVQSCHQGSYRGYFEESKIYLICLTLFLVTT